MCGIAGTYSWGEHRITREEILRAVNALHHRGPDHQDIYTHQNCTLGHARFSVIDTTAAAHQPFKSEDGQFILVFNGELFNYKGLRQSLIQLGITFKTESDTEVVLHHLTVHGEKGLNDFNGFFALALYHVDSDTLLLARDRYGEKPLWYTEQNQTFHFASELKALRLFPQLHFTIDASAVRSYLQLTYIPSPHSIYNNVKKLERGHALRITGKGIENIRWYQEKNAPTLYKDEHQAASDLKELLTDAVKLRLHADIAIGSFLSGGVDSSIIASIASKKTHLQTYSIAFPDFPFLNESEYAEKVAQHIGSQHTTFQVGEYELAQQWNVFLSSIDEPFADSSSLAFSMLSQWTKTEVGVALSGDGADELFGGYHKHQALLLSVEDSIKNKLLHSTQSFWGRFSSDRSSLLNNSIRQIAKYSDGLHQPFEERYLSWASWTPSGFCQTLFPESTPLPFDAKLDPTNFNSVLLADQELVLQNDMLVKVDLMSMHHALEIRTPFLDYRVVEWANTLPTSWKIKKGSGKHILKQAFTGELPDMIFSRRKKGFEIPLDYWLRNHLFHECEAAFSGVFSAEIPINSDAVRELWTRFKLRKTQGHGATTLFSLLVLKKWLDEYHAS